MPELPEMETYRRLLQQQIQGKIIADALVEREKTINMPPQRFAQILQGNRLTLIDRRGKHLLFHLENRYVLLLHLMLGGFLYLGASEDRLPRTAQVTLSFGDRILYFHGLRLGYLHLLTPDQLDERLGELGPEPLAPAFTASQLSQMLAGKRGILKTALVDQHWLAGIGNCYSDEICFRARIMPTRRIPALAPGEIARLYDSMQTVLNEAVAHGGYMETPLYQGDRLTGGFDERCLVYDRGGEPCPRCGHAIVGDRLSSRKVFYCTSCQS
ncbi:DNA-formamidopyrimidine glycosylase family protein [Brevibacillus brevis]|uniref:Formamidopyrimidine-DNA glycosylase n=1 Tax=Brevibacillus brevis TaxID=1393 RepID=A0ABY9T3C6_BREBE|nr:DNA-formamidopyrimidine glycosylase family protein [Brevibacillus brevis]WNC14604.1 DNA-formamidopyrimidine glycosylase family protein [Brevibacillus brevis]